MVKALSRLRTSPRTTIMASAVGAVVLTSVLALSPIRAEPAASPARTLAIPPGGYGCVHSEAVDSLVARLGESAAAQKQPLPDDLKRPMNDREAELLIRALEPVEIEKGKGRGKTIRAVAEGTELSPERMRVLLGDVLTVLADLHSREALADLKRDRDIPQAERILAEEQLRAIGRCAGIHFEDRGGLQALRESRQIVGKHRQEFENLILPAEPWGPLPR